MLRMFRPLALTIALVLGLFAPSLLPAKSPAPAATKTGAAKPAKAQVAHPALWKVSDADTTIWLFGTVHVLPAGLRWYEGPVVTALKSSDELVTEIPEVDAATMQAVVMGTALLPQGESLRALLNPADRAGLEKALAGFGLPPDAFDRFKPWYAAVALTTLPLARSGYTSASGVEEKISTEIRALGRPRWGLETVEDQLGMFDSLPADVQQTYLHEVIEGLPTLDAQLGEIVRQWQNGQADKLAALLNQEEDDPRLSTVLLTDRNRAWASYVSRRLEQPGTVFMAVGAGHLAGKGSVQDLLKQRGIVAARVQ